MEIVSRVTARESGLKWFFTGVPCTRGHVAQRNVVGGYCRACNREDLKSAYADEKKRKQINETRCRRRERNRVHINRVKAEWARNNKDKSADWWKRNKDKKKRYNRSAYLKARKVRIEASAEWKRQNPEKYKKLLSEWRSRNGEKVRHYHHARRVAVTATGGTYTPADINRIFQQQRGKCAYCRAKLGDDYHIDHIVSISAGGSNWPRNLQLTCGISGKRCNLKKRSKDPIDFARSMGLLL